MSSGRTALLSGAELIQALRECEIELDKLVDEYNMVRSIFNRFRESEVAKQRRAIISKIFLVVMVVLAIACGLSFFLSHFLSDEKLKNTFGKISIGTFFSELFAWGLNHYILSKSNEDFSTTFRMLTCNLQPHEMEHYDNLTSALKSLNQKLTSVYGRSNIDTDLLKTDISRIVETLDTTSKPVKSVNDTLDYLPAVVLHAQDRIHKTLLPSVPTENFELNNGFFSATINVSHRLSRVAHAVVDVAESSLLLKP